MALIEYASKAAMSIRYHSKDYAYKHILHSIRNIPFVFKNFSQLEKERYIKDIENKINGILLKTEREWLKDSLDFELSALNLGYCITNK